VSRTLTRRLKDAYLTCHHRHVRRSSDHPAAHARRMLECAAGAHGRPGILCDVGAGADEAALDGAWCGRRIALDIVPGRELDLVADGACLPFRAGSVDVVLLMEVLEHVPAPVRLFQEAARVLRGGGFLCVTAPQYCIVHNYPADYYRYTDQGLRYLCGQAGLRVVDVRPTGGPFLVLFHAVERNLPPRPRLAFVALTCRLLDWLDGLLTDHGARPGVSDAVGWALMAEKPV
jgi:SAM-dependent methyltransferase